MSAPKILLINGRSIEWTICPKHEQYRDSDVLVLSCRKCIIRRIEEDDD